MFATGDTVGQAEWIIDDICLVCNLHMIYESLYYGFYQKGIGLERNVLFPVP